MIRKLLVLSLIIVVVLIVVRVFVVPAATPSCAWPEVRSSIKESQEAQSWTIEENRNLEEFVAHAIVEQKGLGLSRDGAVVAHVPSTDFRNKSVLRAWQYDQGQLSDAPAEAFARVTASSRRSPDLPNYVFWFSFGEMTWNKACVYVQTMYNAGFNGGRGGIGEVWIINKLSNPWAITQWPWYAAD